MQSFFTAALKAGGRIHGEPAVRDQETGYYSAAVLDFDNNSIEVTHRTRAAKPSESMITSNNDPRVLTWQNDVAKSTAGNSVRSQTAPSRAVVNNVTTPTMTITHSTTQNKPKSEISARALVGTLLGAAAGAAVAYAMTKNEEESANATVSKTVTYQTIEAPNPPVALSTAGSRSLYPQSSASDSPPTALQQIEYPSYPNSVAGRSAKPHSTVISELAPISRNVAAPFNLGTLIDTFIPPSEISRHQPRSITRSHTDSIVHLAGSHAPSSVCQPPKLSRASSAAITVTPANHQQAPRSVVTEVKEARDLPLPSSRATSLLGEEQKMDTMSVLGSVAPSDSVSQAGSKRSKSSRRSKNRNSSSSSTIRDIKDADSHVSRRTARHDGSKVQSKKQSVVSMPLRPASQISVRRSVKSFITGL